MFKPFFSSGGASDPLYRTYRDSEWHEDVRARIEELWTHYAPLCGDPEHFLSDARAHFAQRTWELLLAGVLRNAGVPLLPVPPDGPDALVEMDSKRIWIEATAPTKGSGADKVERIVVQQISPTSMMYNIDHDKSTIRYTGALRDKASLLRDPPSQYRGFVDRGVVSENDAFVVAINAGLIPDADLPPDIPNIVRAVLPAGELQYVLPIESDEPGYARLPRREFVQKASGALVPTTAFESKEFENVSAVIFSPHGIWNTSDLSGGDFVMVHNPTARLQIPLGLFPFGREFWIHIDEHGATSLRCRRNDGRDVPT